VSNRPAEASAGSPSGQSPIEPSAPPIPARITLMPSLDELDRMIDWLDDHTRQASLPPRLVQRLDLCATELVTNIISYAYTGIDRRPISLHFALAEYNCHLVIEDEGIPFDPFASVVYEPASRLERAEPGGRGVALIREFADEIHYLRIEGRNRVSLTFCSDSSS
jgi:anti-sigma regulatory factor (Ser/Thr protein kinase)